MSSNQPLMDRIAEELANAEQSTQSALSAVLEAAILDVSASESSILIPGKGAEEELSFYLSTNPRLLEADIPSVPINDSIAGIALMTGQAIAVDEPRFSAIDTKTGVETRTYIATPIIAGGEIAGVLTLVNRVGTEEPFTQDEIAAAAKSADTCGFLLAHAKRLREQTKSTIDGLEQKIGSGGNSGLDHDDPLSHSAWSPDLAARRMEAASLLESVEDDDIELLIQLLQRLAHSDAPLSF